jgi:hypothetical protein
MKFKSRGCYYHTRNVPGVGSQADFYTCAGLLFISDEDY